MSGAGPVDFKFSAGWRRRALIEVKLLASSKLRQGAEAQLPQYMASERLSCALHLRRFHRRRLPPGTPSTRPRHMRGVPGKIQKNGDSAFRRCETKEVSFEARTSLAKLTRASSCTRRPTAQIISHPRACHLTSPCMYRCSTVCGLYTGPRSALGRQAFRKKRIPTPTFR